MLPEEPYLVIDKGMRSVNTSPLTSVVVTFTNLLVVELLADEASTVATYGLLVSVTVVLPFVNCTSD